ncbi:hypothetical protein ACIBSW_38400 [Actinoplanes sp. NPDC049668]|uniref:hypothetical protein n=1 Tax=unclassified Actinoplanes TaxID=2626549 RepID=UPI0033A49B60
MVETVDVTELLRRLAAIEWTWTPDGVRSALVDAGWAPVETAGGRCTYRLGDRSLDTYADGDRVVRAEVTLAASWPEPDDEYQDDLIDEYYQLWEETAEAAVPVLGKPSFNDGFGNDGFPSDQNAGWATVWPRDTARIMITQVHEGKELPYRLLAVCAPPCPRE